MLVKVDADCGEHDVAQASGGEVVVTKSEAGGAFAETFSVTFTDGTHVSGAFDIPSSCTDGANLGPYAKP